MATIDPGALILIGTQPPPAASIDPAALLLLAAGGPPPLPADLLDAAVAALRSALAGRGITVHAGYAGPGASQPYCVIRDRLGGRQYNSEGTWIAWGTLDVIPYAATRDAALAIRQAADAALADAPLSFLEGRLYYLRPADRSTEKDPDLAMGAQVAFQEPRTYAYGLIGP